MASEAGSPFAVLHLEAPGAWKLLYHASDRRLPRIGGRREQPRERAQRQPLLEQEAHQRPLLQRRRCPNLTPVRRMTLKDALEYIGEDELVEITPESIRLPRKVFLASLARIGPSLIARWYQIDILNNPDLGLSAQNTIVTRT